MRIVLLLLFIGLYGCSSASNYYISSSAGDDNRTAAQATNPTTPWKSIAKLNAMANIIKPGDSLLLKKGDVWMGTTLIPMSDHIVFGTYGTGAAPIIDGGVNFAVNVLPTFQNNIVFDGLTFQRSLTKGVVANFGNVWQNGDIGMNYSTITNCSFYGTVLIQGSYNNFKNNLVNGTTNDGNGNGVWEYKGYCHHNSYTGNTISNFTSRGIWSMVETHESLFSNNTIHDCGLAGIDLDAAYYAEYGHTVSGNTIYNMAHDAIEFENAFDCSAKNNYMYNAAHSFIYIINYQKCEIVDNHGANNGIGALINAEISNNVMIGGGTDFTSTAIGIYKAGGINVYNNTIYNFKSRFFNLDYALASEVPMIRLVNNLFSTINAPSWYTMISFSNGDKDVLAQDDYNCFYDNGRDDIYPSGSMDQYKTLTGKASHSISVDPLFNNTSTNDLHLKASSPCIDAGLNVGIAFFNKTPDIGAFEYQKNINAPVVVWSGS